MNKGWEQNIIIFVLALFLTALIFHQAHAGLVSNFSDQLSSQTIATAANHTITFTISSNFEPNDTLELFFETDFDLSEINYSDIDLEDDGANKNLGVSPGNGVGANIGATISGQTITFIQNDTDTLAAGSVITIKIGTNATHQAVGVNQIYNPSAAGTYIISVSGTFSDMGTIVLQILTTDSVGFSATVEQNLSFELRNGDDTGAFTGCDFGTGSYLRLSECSVRLAIDTNLFKGFQVFIQSDGNLQDQDISIENISEDQIVTVGTEGYGLALTGAAGMTEVGDFNDDDTPIPSTDTLLLSSNSVYNYIQGDLSTSDKITIKLAVSPQTKPGSYSQLITFSLLANF